MKKKILIALSTASALILSSAIFAQTAPQPAPSSDTTLLEKIAAELTSLPTGITAGMNQGFSDLETSLENFLDELYNDGKQWVSKRDHAYNPNIPNIISLNNITVPLSAVAPNTPAGSTTTITLSQAIKTQAQQSTSNSIQNALTQFFYSLNQANTALTINSAEGEPFAKYLDKNSTEKLILGKDAQASDSLYLTDPTSQASLTAMDPNNKKLLSAPATINNGQFVFTTVLNPTSYTPTQLQQAHNFLSYATLSGQNLLGNVSFSGLYSNAKALIALKNSRDYQQFMLTIRNMLALRSVSLSIFNELIAERTPIPNLGAAIGQSGTSASPLQVEEYRATHDLNNPAWYYGLTSEEPATVQRDILITLKEIERQNFQTQMQNERLLSAILAMSLQGSAASGELLKMQQGNLEKAVKAALATGAPVKNNNNSTAQPGGLASPPVVQNYTGGSAANIAWGGLTNAPSGTTYKVTVTPSNGDKATDVMPSPPSSTGVQLVGLKVGVTYNITVTPMTETGSSVGTGGSVSLTVTAPGTTS